MRLYKDGGSRSGDLLLREQRLTLPMLEILRTETAMVKVTLVQYLDDAAPRLLPRRGGKFFPPPNEFLHLHIKVINLSRK
jgi:hypothetical protein